ncbi:methane monooxygenase/ammonia monooxygenase subunit B [Actinoallomurus rhizosphaericola]|uniref:methane monooxygenase/ammonia monooxygenase subunit B n=1 Tax=Actinoallomurus rhizosphaericola TaxID=2952536 RepID=UPI002091F08F|nr:methane monooxygenase/ammonia monooxygenase subunit B [Actinoallomurus rhizosphaericola]MCO5998816.1 methane monooxygenase/ammonia monooxygenase subunit B [Actinoallomurus rhizosphaericola]
MAALVGCAAAAGYAVKALTVPEPRPARVVDADGDADLAHLSIRADPRLVPVTGHRLVPGRPARYTFTVTNAGPEAVRHVVARSVKVAAPGTDDRLAVVSVSDPSCWGMGRVECIFQRLGPGETRTVRVVVNTPDDRPPRGRMTINTFLGRFTGPVGGTIPLEVIGEVRATTGRFP